MNIIFVAIGGGLGAVCRYLLGILIKSRAKERSVPMAMLGVNLIGSFGLGLFFGLIYQEIPFMVYDDPLFLFIGIGYFGAFTTFSTFSVEAATLYKKSKWKPLIAYISLSIGGCIFIFFIGMLISVITV